MGFGWFGRVKGGLSCVEVCCQVVLFLVVLVWLYGGCVWLGYVYAFSSLLLISLSRH